MIPFLLSLLAVQAASQADESRFKACIAQIKTNPAKAVETANGWLPKGGGMFARQCLAQAYVAQQRWASAAAAFEQAAREADGHRDPRGADFWVQSGNAWLAADDAGKARSAFDAALATTALTPELRGEVHLDRARAGVAAGDLPGARADLQKGLELVPADPFAWYLSAALAWREGNLSRAKVDIARALQMAPNDADLLLLAGNIAGLSGETEAARTLYGRAARAAPGTAVGRAAEAALAANPPADATQPPEQGK